MNKGTVGMGMDRDGGHIQLRVVFKQAKGSFLAGSGSSELGELSSEDKDLVSLEISQTLSPLLLGKGLSKRTLSELLSNTLLGDNGSELASASSTTDLDDLLGELESADRDDLALDVLAINEHTLVVDDVDNSGELALQGTVVDTSHPTDLDELAVALNQRISTISLVVKYIDY